MLKKLLTLYLFLSVYSTDLKVVCSELLNCIFFFQCLRCIVFVTHIKIVLSLQGCIVMREQVMFVGAFVQILLLQGLWKSGSFFSIDIIKKYLIVWLCCILQNKGSHYAMNLNFASYKVLMKSYQNLEMHHIYYLEIKLENT